MRTALASTRCWHDKPLKYFNLYRFGGIRLPTDRNRNWVNRYLAHLCRHEPIAIREGGSAHPVPNPRLPLYSGRGDSPNAVVVWYRRLAGIQCAVYLDPEGELFADCKLRLIDLRGDLDVLLLGVDGRYRRGHEGHGEGDAGEGASYERGMSHVGAYHSFVGGSGDTRICCNCS